MGLSFPVPVSVVEFSTPIGPPITINVAGYSGDLGYDYIEIPSWLDGKIDRAYLDWYIPWIVNTNVALNWIGTSDDIDVSPGNTGNYYKAITLMDGGCLMMPGSSTYTGSLRITGSIDIAQYVRESVGSHLHCFLEVTTAHLDSLVIYFNYCVLRVYIKG